MTLLKTNLLQSHLFLALFLVMNFICNANFGISLNWNMVFILKIVFYLSGLILFFITVKPFQKISIYFSLYVAAPLLIFIGWLIDGIFGALLAPVFLFFLVPNDTLYQFENVTIYRKFNGFLGGCCDYEFTRKELLIFERKVGELNFGHIDFAKVKMELKSDTLYVPLVLKEYDAEGYDYPKDSIVKISVK